jgi:hypothetical protein
MKEVIFHKEVLYHLSEFKRVFRQRVGGAAAGPFVAEALQNRP